MKVVCSKESLLKSLNTVTKAVPVRTTMEVLKCIYLNASGEELILTGNDTSLGIETKEKVLVLEEGEVCVDANLFTSIIRKLPDNDISIVVNNKNEVHIQCESSNFNISGMETKDFIKLPDITVKEKVKVTEYTIKEMISQVIFSIADSNLNAAMSGVYIEVENNVIKMTTLDGHRISIRTNILKDSYSKIASIILGKTMNDLSKILTGDAEKELYISFSDNHIVFEFGNTKMVSRVIEGEYFKIDTMLKDGYETKIKINKKTFYNSLDRSTLLVNESDKKPVILNVTDDNINLKLKSVIGEMNEDLPLKKEGKDIKIAFNTKLLLDALKVIEDEEIELYFVRYNYPCTIKDNEGRYIYVVLPVNFTED